MYSHDVQLDFVTLEIILIENGEFMDNFELLKGIK